MGNELAVTRISHAIKKLGDFLIRYGLVLVLGWIGAMKFTAYEAEALNR
jgi:reactive chlorine resistance protein C